MTRATDSLIGLKYPFRISGGMVTTTSNPSEIVAANIVFCIGAQVGERVMRPTWGVEILNSVYAMGGNADDAVVEGVEAAFNSWFPQFELRSVRTTRNDYQPSWIDIEIRYGKPGDTSDLVSKVGLAAPDGSEMFSGEGR